jgi:methionyl-tRNA formyltransferase
MILTPTSLRDPGFVDQVRSLVVDVAPIVAFGGLITPELLGVPRLGWINLHFSLLPAYRGAAPVQRALLDGLTETGLTTFHLVEALDAGPIYRQERLAISEAEIAGELLDRLAHRGATAMVETLALAESGFTPEPQTDSGVSLAAKIQVSEARLDPKAPAKGFVNRVRALSPAPGAWAMFGEARFKILRARTLEQGPIEATVGDPGQLWATKKELLLRVGDGWVELLEVQPLGKRVMPGADWARGACQMGASLA